MWKTIAVLTAAVVAGSLLGLGLFALWKVLA